MFLESFLQYLQHEKRYSRHTVQAYKTDIQQFFKFLSLQYHVDDPLIVSHFWVRSWIIDLLSKDIGNRSIQRKLSSLTTFYRHLRRRGLIDHNPVSAIQAPKQKKVLPSYIREPKMDVVMMNLPIAEDFQTARDRLLIEILYQTGMRRSELISLTKEDVSLDNRFVKIHGKRNKERMVPFGQGLKISIQQYISFRDQQFPDSESWLFLTNKGKKLYPKLVYQTVRKYLTPHHAAEKQSPHVLRHTFATHLLNKGADLNAIKELLGHENLGATQIYTHTSMQKLKSVYKKAHPKATLEK